MRKCLMWVFATLLIFTLASTAFATEDLLRVRDVTAQKGETVYVTVELTGSVTGDSVGISYTYDEKSLTLVTESCSWVRKGVLQDFNEKNHIGVWTVSQSEDLKGGVCVLAFEVSKKAKFTKTEVSCTVTVKESGETVGTYTAKGSIIMDCEHTYGQWTDGGDIGHVKTCTLCNGTQTQSHQWNDGIVTSDPHAGSNIITYTCQICGGTMTHQTSQEATVPTLPQSNEPTLSQIQTDNNQPDWSGNDDHDHTHTQEGENVEQGDHSNGETTETAPSVETDDHQHDHEEDVTQEVDPHAGHDHGSSNQGGNPGVTAAVVFVVLAALVAAGVYFVKKK